jgi:hypothetical protein
MINIVAERQQLLDTWKSAFSTRWMERPRSCVTSLVSPTETVFGMHFRQTHNIFGWMAGNTLARRGLCSGAIYRSERFMALPQAARSGSAGPRKSLIHLQNVHIEHTVPIAALTKRWTDYREGRELSLAVAYAWMFVHSISSAVHMAEKGGLGHYESRTDAFDPTSPHYDRPFMRYSHREEPLAIWNVLSGERVVPESWTFADHLSAVASLFSETCEDDVSAAAILGHATLMIRDIAEARSGSDAAPLARAV